MPIKDSLVSWWTLEEESGNRADSHGTNTLTDVNTVTYDAGIIGNAAQFTNATTEYLNIVSNATVQTGNIDFTIAAWVYLDNNATNQMLVGKDHVTAGQREYVLKYSQTDDNFQFSVFTAVDTAVSVDENTLGTPSVATWYYVVVWHDAAGDTINIQVNNNTTTSQATGGSLQAASTAPLRLGARLYTDFEDYLDGRMDETAIWKRVLTANEKTWLYNGGVGRSYAELFIPTATTIF